jgi:hypothetical protein
MRFLRIIWLENYPKIWLENYPKTAVNFAFVRERGSTGSSKREIEMGGAGRAQGVGVS